jgi:hypothetical protein
VNARARFAALAGLVLLSPAAARAETPRSLTAPQHVESARQDAKYTFCTSPKVPLSPRQRALCPLASEVDGCEGLVAACKADAASAAQMEELRRSLERGKSGPRQLLGAVGFLAQGLLWLLVALVIAAIAFPLVRALLRARRDKRIADAPVRPNVALPVDRPPPPPAEAISDAEAALREADEHARRGELTRALGLYLAASLAALDRRGAIRLARHRTNGEYVRSCAEDAARQPLREIVREVDRVEFGKVIPTGESVANVAARASAVVRSGASRAAGAVTTTALLALLAFAALGCGGSHRTGGATVSDPSGDELPIDVLRRSGYDAAYLTTSLAALPIPGPSDLAPIVVVDVERVVLEEESTAHLLRWVDAGGVLVLFGAPDAWPADLHVTAGTAHDDHVDVLTEDVYARGARVGVRRALSWPESEAIAFTGKSVYAAHVARGKGMIVGVAGRELATNVGVARPDNAGAFVAILDVAVSDRRAAAFERSIADEGKPQLRFARAEDGIPPPTNPFSALVQAGLGRGAWHALAAVLVLFLAFGIRHARPRPLAPAARRAFAEHVEATGAFYGRAGAVGHALASYGHFAEMRLRERIPRGTDPVAFLAARTNVAPEEVARVWKRATEASADEPARGDELTTIKDLGALLAKAL